MRRYNMRLNSRICKQARARGLGFGGASTCQLLMIHGGYTGEEGARGDGRQIGGHGGGEGDEGSISTG